MGLTLEERGAYTTILDLIYDRGGPLPDNERLVAGYLEISTRMYRTVRDSLIAKGKLHRTPEGDLFNGRASRELSSSEKNRRILSECGANGGRKRVENLKKRNEINEGGQATLKPPSTDIERDRDTVPKGTGGEPPIDLVKMLFDEGVPLLVAKGAKPPAARSHIGKWRKQAGNTAEGDGLVLDAVREARDRQIGEPAEWIGPYLKRRLAGTDHGAGESYEQHAARQATIARQTAERIAHEEKLAREAVNGDELAAILAARDARRGRQTLQ
jgi:uncharacterized protein YdaU (DUF1376 family)